MFIRHLLIVGAVSVLSLSTINVSIANSAHDVFNYTDADASARIQLAGWFSVDNADDFKVDKDELKSDDVPKSVVKVMMEEIDLNEPKDEVSRKIKMLNDEQRLLYSMMLLRESVNEGGFDMYLSTDAANLLPDVKKGLDKIGATQYLILVNKALKLFVDDEYALDNKFTRRKVLGKLSRENLVQVLEPLDNKFFEYERDNILQEKLTDFIKKNSKQFVAK